MRKIKVIKEAEKKYSRAEAEKYFIKSYGVKNVHFAYNAQGEGTAKFHWMDLNSGEVLPAKEAKPPKDLKAAKKGDEKKHHPANLSESLIDEPRKVLQKALGITAVVTSGDLKDDDRVLDMLTALAAVVKKLPKSTSFGFKEKGGKVVMSFGGLFKDGGDAIEKVVKSAMKKAGVKGKFTEPRELGGRKLGRTFIKEAVVRKIKMKMEVTTTANIPAEPFKPSGTFRSHPYFDCPQGVFDNCFKGKKKGSHWKKWLGDDKFSENIKAYIKKNPKKTFLFRDEKSKAFIFARKFY